MKGSVTQLALSCKFPDYINLFNPFPPSVPIYGIV